MYVLQVPIARTVPPVSMARSPVTSLSQSLSPPGCTDGQHVPAGQGGRAERKMLLREVMSLFPSWAQREGGKELCSRWLGAAEQGDHKLMPSTVGFHGGTPWECG